MTDQVEPTLRDVFLEQATEVLLEAMQAADGDLRAAVAALIDWLDERRF